MPENVFVRGASKSNFEGMTKEQILATIAQAIESGTIGDVDTGFVTTLKEINSGAGFKIWLGTTAEFNALTETETNVLYIKTDDTSAQDISNALASLTENQTSHVATKATATTLGHVTLTTSTDIPTENMDGVALAGTMGYTLWNHITMSRIPVGGMLVTGPDIATVQDLLTVIDYGAWSLFGSIAVGSSTVNFFKRMS